MRRFSMALAMTAGLVYGAEVAGVEEGLKLYQTKEYEQAFQVLSEAFLEDPSNPRVNFYLGLTAAALKRYDDAVAAYERVLINNPAHHRARLEMGRSLLALGMLPQAEEEFKKVREAPDVPDKVKANLDKLLALLESKKKYHHINAILMAGLGYDSNIESAPIQDTILLGGYEFQIDQKEIGELLHQEMVNLTYRYDPNDTSKPGYTASIMAFYQNYVDHTSNNIRLLQATAGTYGNWNKGTWQLLLGLDDLTLDGKEFAMKAWGLTPKGTYKLQEGLILEGSYRYQRRGYETAGVPSDTTAHDLTLALNRQIPTGLLTGTLLLASEHPDDKEDINNRKEIQAITGGYGHNLTPRLTVTGTLGIKRTAYPEWQPDQRDDTTTTIGLSALYKIRPTLMVNGTLGYLKNDSSEEISTYRKSTGGVSLLALF